MSAARPAAGGDRRFVVGLALAALLLAAAAAWRGLGPLAGDTAPASAPRAAGDDAAGLRGFAIDPPAPAPALALVDAAGRAWRGSDQRGRVWAVFFGYTHCPDICPQTLSALAAALERLGPTADAVTVALVTVDPARDTPDVLQAYTAAFDPRFVGLSGSVEAITAAADAWGVAFEREAPPAAATAAGATAAGRAEGHGGGIDLPGLAEGGGGYTIVHSGTVFLVDRQGRLRSGFVGAIDPADVAHDLARLVAEPAP